MSIRRLRRSSKDGGNILNPNMFIGRCSRRYSCTVRLVPSILFCHGVWWVLVCCSLSIFDCRLYGWSCRSVLASLIIQILFRVVMTSHPFNLQTANSNHFSLFFDLPPFEPMTTSIQVCPIVVSL